jgi:mannose-1-phosphate guanylyltransferase
VVVVLPSDHWVDDDETLRRTVATAAAAVRDDGHRLILLGMEPADGDTEYGWIVPRSTGAPGLCAVEQFVEKPRAEVCRRLRADGALVNSMIVVARASALLNLFYLATPRLLWEFVQAHENAEGDGLDSLYEFLPKQDFSRDVLEPLGDRLTVLPVPECGWTDVGTPNRVARLRRAERGPLRVRRAAAGATRADGVSARH